MSVAYFTAKMEQIELACVLITVGTKLGISPSLIREIWSILPQSQCTVNGRFEVDRPKLDEGVKFVGTDLYGNLAVREWTRETTHVLDIVSTSDVRTSLVRLVPYDLQSSNGQIPATMEAFGTCASFSLDDRLVAVAMYRHGSFIVFIFDRLTGHEVKLLTSSITYVGQYSRLSFGAKTLYFVTNFTDWYKDIKAWDITTWNPVDVGSVGPEARYIAPLQPGIVKLESSHHLIPTLVPTLTIHHEESQTTIHSSNGNFKWFHPFTSRPVIHYRADLDTVWIVVSCEDQPDTWRLSEWHPLLRQIDRIVVLEEQPYEIAVSKSGTWLTLVGPHTIVRLNRHKIPICVIPEIKISSQFK
jgi:hypothetical protein